MFCFVLFGLERQTVWLQRFCQLLTEFIAAEHRSKELPSRSARFGETFCTTFCIYFPSCLVVLNWLLKLCFEFLITINPEFSGFKLLSSAWPWEIYAREVSSISTLKVWLCWGLTVGGNRVMWQQDYETELPGKLSFTDLAGWILGE